jgi:DnaJ like chaperone protein
MSIWGKLAGGLAGLAVGGPIGALLGAVAGHYAMDRDRSPEAQEARDQVVFTIGVIALSAKMAKADGEVTEDEIAAFRQVVHVPPSEERHVRRIFDLARQSTAGFEGYARQIARLFADRPQVLEDLLDGLFHIAGADGRLHPNELAFLEEVARIFGFSEDAFTRLKTRHMGPDKSDPWYVLGLERGASEAEVKAAYRRLVKEHHPDALIARGVPEEFVKMATDRLVAINAAYEQIRAKAGM